MAANEKSEIEEKSKCSQEKPALAENEAESESWDKIYDDSGESVLEKLENLTISSKKDEDKLKKESEKNEKSVAKKDENESKTAQLKEKPKEKKIDYLKFPESKLDEDEFGDEFAHLVEIFDFPTTFKNQDILITIKNSIGNDEVSLKWVDDTHCLGIFSNATEASKAIAIENALIKMRPISKASQESKRIARQKIQFLKPYKARPQTSSFVASKLIGASLGINNLMSKEKAAIEKMKIHNAREKRHQEKELKEAVWNGQ